ncbi:hypothetical protein LMG19282_02019 [Cupriavidus campinensis]|nr:hypothetical protein LMG19282_02019 [Cupriavidus campinensis]
MQPTAFHDDLPAGHAEGIKAATAAIDWNPGGQRRAARVDETRAIYQDPVGIGHDDFRTRPGNLEVAAQLAGQRARDLVDDDPCGPAGLQIGIAVDVASLLGRHDARRVVEDGAGFVDVELVVVIDGDTRPRRPRDVDLRQAVRRLDDARTVCAGIRVRNDLRTGHHRQPHRHPPCQLQHRNADTEASGCAAPRGTFRWTPPLPSPRAGTAGCFLHGHQHGACLVEDETVTKTIHSGPRRLAHAWLSSAIWSYSRQRVAKHRAITAGLLVTSCKFFENEGERTARRKVRHTPLFSDSIACPRHKSAPPESRARPSKGFPGKPAVFTIPSNLSHQ